MTLRMKAAVLYEQHQPLRIEEVEVPEPAYGQVLVRLAASGVCRKQLEEMSGRRGPDLYLPHLLGHEGAGIVQAVGPGVTRAAPGDRVVLSWIKGPGINAPPPKYRNGSRVFNAGQITTFNEYAVVAENRVTPIRKEMPLDKAALLGCAVPTGFGIVINQAKVEPGSAVAVFGVGGVGLNVIQAAALMNAGMVIAVDIQDHKLALARQLGATHAVNARTQDAVAAIKQLTGGQGADYAIECIGNPKTMEQAYQATRELTGLTLMAGVPPQGAFISIDPFPLYFGKRLSGVHGGDTRPERDIPRYVELFLSGRLKLDELMTHRFRLDQINEACAALERGEVGRAIVEFTS